MKSNKFGLLVPIFIFASHRLSDLSQTA